MELPPATAHANNEVCTCWPASSRQHVSPLKLAEQMSLGCPQLALAGLRHLNRPSMDKVQLRGGEAETTVEYAGAGKVIGQSED